MNNSHNVTMRQFAEVNNLALVRLRVLIKNDKSVRVAFTRKSVNYHDRAHLDAWLVENKYRFSDKSVYLPIENGSLFYCSRQSHYVPIGQRSSKLSLCCIGCERTSKSHLTIIANRTPKRGDTVSESVKKHRADMNKAAYKIEDKAIDDIDSWMNE